MPSKVFSAWKNGPGDVPTNMATIGSLELPPGAYAIAAKLYVAQGSGSNQVTPDTRHFRKMSVYVKDKRIIRVVEKIDVEPLLDGLEKIYDTKFPADVPKSVLATIAIEALNVIRTGQGQDPIRMRDMEYSLKDLGADVKVDMPTDTIKGSAALLQNRGRPADAANGVLEAAALRAQAAAPPPAQPTG